MFSFAQILLYLLSTPNVCAMVHNTVILTLYMYTSDKSGIVLYSLLASEALCIPHDGPHQRREA